MADARAPDRIPDPNSPPEAQADTLDPPSGHTESSRLQLVWDVFVFQFKLAADGLRDLVLSPLSMIAALMGLLAGGDDPHYYFRRLLRVGRRSEVWINLFGYRKHGGTSDELIDPIKRRVMTEATTNPALRRASSEINRTLDSVNASVGASLKGQPGDNQP